MKLALPAGCNRREVPVPGGEYAESGAGKGCSRRRSPGWGLPGPHRTFTVWIGLRKVDGEPAISASRADAGRYFLRNHDPMHPLNLLPVKRAPLVRLELDP